MYEADIDDDSTGSLTSEDEIKCIELTLPKHVIAYLQKEELLSHIEPLTCDDSLMEKVTANYVIAKKIISNLSWQDKLVCKRVCSMWHSAVHTLQKEQMWPADFSVNFEFTNIKNGIKFRKSSSFYTEPLVVLIFSNRSGFNMANRCESLVPSPCNPACEKDHSLINLIQREIAAPKNCVLVAQSCHLTYLPLPQSSTYENAIKHKMYKTMDPFVCGLYIPVIQNVKFTVIKITSVELLKEQFHKVVDKLAETRYIKGALVFANDNYLLERVEDIIFLNYIKKVQPDVPYALGGCLIEDTISSLNEIKQLISAVNENKEFVSQNLISIGLFSVPRDVQQECHFDMYSLILESSDWDKVKIQTTINEFAKSVPNFEHSVALRLSCVGRAQRHEMEQLFFRTAFPNTRLVGCYGNGELGVNRPVRTDSEEAPKAKRHRRDPGPQYDLMYSYSTVFVYIGWGKILSQARST